MKRILFGLALFAASSCRTQTAPATGLKLVQTIMLNVPGRLDHMIVDRLNDRAFVAASTNGTVEVIDLKTGRTVASLVGPGRPVDLVYFKKCDCVAYSTSSGTLRILNPNALAVEGEFEAGPSAGAVGLDPQHDLLYAAQSGGASGSSLSFVDLMKHKSAGAVRLDSARLGQMALEHHGPRGYLNATSTGEVLVLDLSERKVVDRWKIDGIAKNVAIALDEKQHRIFVASRRPGMLSILNASNGAVVAQMKTMSDVEDISYDATLHRVYLSGGEGFVAVLKQIDADHYERLAQIKTAVGGSTSKWVPEQNRLYVEVSPRKPSQRGRILVYESVE